MDGRCTECGFVRQDYESVNDREWLIGALSYRAHLVFEGLPAGTAIGGHADADALSRRLGDLAEAGDLHGGVHLTHEASLAAARLVSPDGGYESGVVVQVSTSKGGVPKLPLGEAEVGWRGLAGDEHDEVLHHGHAWQALCLWSAEVIEALVSEGHPIRFGSAGENLTFRGLDWPTMRTGVLLAVGEELVAELTGPATPCKTNAQWFINRRFDRVDHGKHPGWSRWYATVLRPGHVQPGDEARILGGVGSVSPSAGRP